MAGIGRVTKQKDGSMTGFVQTLSMESAIAIKITPVKSKPTEKHPDYSVTSRGMDIGAGWNKVSLDGNPYVSLSLEAPEISDKRLYCNLGKEADQDDPDVLAVIWNAKKAYKKKEAVE